MGRESDQRRSPSRRQAQAQPRPRYFALGTPACGVGPDLDKTLGLGRIRSASSAVGRGASGSRLEVASVGPSPALAGTAAGLMIDRHKGGMPNESVGAGGNGRHRTRARPRT
jgi:hypothetical protein